MSQLDWLIATLPKVHPRSPLPGPARLKAVLQNHGFTCTVKDLNNDLFHRISKEKGLEFWSGADFSFTDNKAFEKFYREGFEQIVEEWALELLKYKPKFLGLSLLSKHSRLTAAVLLKKLRQQNPQQKLIVGGPGALYCGEDFKKRGLVDHYIIGEAELAILELSKNNLKFVGIDSPGRQLTNEELDQQPFNDYSDSMQNIYPDLEGGHNPADFKAAKPQRQSPELNTLYIEGSRGCIRRCSFCAVISHTDRFRWRSGKLLADEIIHYHQKYGATKFEFSDNLVNGNVQCLREMCEKLIAYKTQGFGPFQLEGNFLCRSQSSFGIPYFDLMKEAGFSCVSMGLESASEAVRTHMGKGFTNVDLQFSIRELRKRNITISFLFVLGYPTETDQDHEENLHFLHWLKATEGVKGMVINAGSTMQLGSTIPIWEQVDELGIENKESSTHWRLKDNTREKRLARYLDFCQKARDLGFVVNDRFYHAYEEEYQSYQVLHDRKTEAPVEI